ncbi:unnamed protein product [Strongylus vulgaris]|uniref:Uncharacterized protein n=1 Tax=Strongylus vulgaris TaxID=40348 RepID=A0A3P7IZ02_STRVU|nr:unnamed protein product [Strongylus vulgaris]
MATSLAVLPGFINRQCFEVETIFQFFPSIPLLPAMTGRADGEKEEEISKEGSDLRGEDRGVNVTLPVVEKAQ